MNTRTKLRLICLAMLLVAIVFVFCALACPTLGRTIYIGSIVIGAKQWRFFYKIYVAVMLLLFGVSFFVKKK